LGRRSSATEIGPVGPERSRYVRRDVASGGTGSGGGARGGDRDAKIDKGFQRADACERPRPVARHVIARRYDSRLRVATDNRAMNDATTIFTVHGPRVIPTYRGKGGRTITDDDVRAFWRANGDITTLRGCYVFAVRTSRAMKPAYVGKATHSFRREAFQYHKLTRYQQQLADSPSGTPVMFFVSLPRRRGAPATTHVAQLERYLIELAARINPDLLNVRCVVAERWRISGVLRRTSGKPSAAARAFKTLMHITR
jgi:hypothetical protein